MTDAAEDSGSPGDRLARLVDRLLASANRARAAGAWDRVEEIVRDVLAVAPGDRRAADLLWQAGVEQLPSPGERALVSLLFSDIVRSTPMAEQVEPETMRDLFNMYRQVARGAIDALEGTVLQFQGDGIVACFGHPRAHGNDAQRAVLAGLEIVARAGPEIRRRLGVEAPVRVGIHSGTVVAGFAPGAGGGMDVVGAATNMAARLQAVAEPDTVVISDATRALVEQAFEVSPLGTRSLKGIAQLVEVFRVERPRPAGAQMDTVKLHSVALIGREPVRRRLREVWRQTVGASEQGEPPSEPMVVLRGPPGIGKSRVAADFCDYVNGQGEAALRTECSPFHTNVALWPMIRLAERRLGMHPGQTPQERLDILRRRAEEIGFDAPTAPSLLAWLLGLEPDGPTLPDLDAVARRAEGLRVFARWIALAATRQPLLMVIDDLQWADPTTLDLLGMLVSAPVPGLVLVVGSRETLAAEWARLATDVELGPLDDEDARALVAEIVARRPLGAGEQRRIVERAGGIPLFIEELARSVAAARHQEHLPLRLQELLAARLRAPGIDLRLAQLAATFGPVFDRALLAQLASIPVDRGLADLEAAGIVEPLGDPSGRAYQFSHVLLRDAAYETQVLEVRRDAHRRIARMLQAALEPSPGDAAVTAQHLDLAGEVTEAVSTYVQAAQQAQVVASHLEARRLLSRALELLATTPEGESREITEIMVRMLRALSVVSVFGYPHPEVLEDCEAANELCRRHKDRPEVMPAEVGIWSYFFARAEHRIARAVIQRVAERIEVPQGAWFTPEVKSCLGFDLLYAGELLQARTVLDESWSGFMARPPEERVWSLWRLSYDPVALVATGLACLDALQGRSAHSEIWTARAIERAEGLGRQGAFTLGFVTLYLAWLRMVMGDPAGSYRYGCQTIEIGERYGFDYWAVLGRPFVLISEPGVPMHPELMDRIEADMDAIGHWAFRPAYLGNEARARALLGDLPGALETVEQALALNQKLEEWIHQPDLLRLRAELRALADGGRMGEVVDDLHSAVEAGMSQGSLALALRAGLDLARLPAGARPPDWRRVLGGVLDALPADADLPGIAEGRAALLDG